MADNYTVAASSRSTAHMERSMHACLNVQGGLYLWFALDCSGPSLIFMDSPVGLIQIGWKGLEERL